jgi:hypothetical protein
MCAHENLMQLRLLTYTRYGAMCGCLGCGTSWLIRGTDWGTPRDTSDPRSQETKPTG